MFLTLEQGKELRLLDLVWGCGFGWLVVCFSFIPVISKRLGASDPIILLQSLRNLKKKKAGGAVNVS